MNKMCSYKYLVKMVESNDIEMVQNIISNYQIENHNFFTEQNIFNYLVKQILSNYPHTMQRKGGHIEWYVPPRYNYFTGLFESLLKNDQFFINSENIRICVSHLHNEFPLHNLIIEKIKKQNTISNFSIEEKTKLLLLISENGLNRNDYYVYRKLNYKKYLSIFTHSEIQDCQSYFIKNYETFFNNFYSSIPETKNIKNNTRKFVKQVLIKQNYHNINFKIDMPKQNNVLLGQDIKYVNMVSPLFHFIKRQKKVKYGRSCLFQNPEKFFLFFSEYIRPHTYNENYDNIIIWIKTLQKKYNLSSISWDNRYFYDKDLTELKKLVHQSIIKSLSFFNMTDLNTIHLQFISTYREEDYSGIYDNNYSSIIKKNSHVIQMNCSQLNPIQYKVEFQNTFLHELTHFLHFQKKNSGCFYNEHFKKIRDKLYLHKDRQHIISIIRKITNKDLSSSLEQFFIDNAHLSYRKIHLYLKEFINIHSRYEKEINNIDSLIKDYKKYKYTDSKLYITWNNYALACNLNPTYFNFCYEIHARLNEMLLCENLPELLNMGYFETNGELFQSIKNDLIEFNRFLMK